ncbi:30S ribosomal protein S4 [Candidatus Nanosalina sp. VS9-1]|uniref:30S ribosomal protein S4 n=1 Tax=Candidatus Nanosalina sp. VS9-1 TaxID=3388566 RepID=UPI0039E070C1
MVKKLKKQYETPSEAWDEERIEKEKELIEEFGLSNKREVYKAESELRGLRRQARKAVASDKEDQKKPLLDKAHRLGLIKSDGEIVDILSLETRDILNRRLQSAVERKGFADTPKQARQRVVHGHIYLNGERVTVPGYLLTQEEEKNLELQMPEQEDEEEASEEAEETENSEEVEEESEEEE